MVMIKYFHKRRLLKHLRQLLREAQHVRNLKEDIAEPRLLRNLVEACRKAELIVQARNWPAMDAAGRELENAISPMCPPRPYAAIRENLEIILVAVAVAMAFRTYFIQPFKIPTASMSPTLYGIHYAPQASRGLTDRLPLNLVKWLIFGEWYTEVRAKTSGQVRLIPGQDDRIMVINGYYHPVNKALADHVSAGDDVVKGQLLASGIKVTGDHIFVDKVSWNFRPPRRGEIMVFMTSGIQHPQIKTNEHYVKRMVGLPNEVLSFKPPEVQVNGQPVTDSPYIVRVESQRDGYTGYQMGGRDYKTAAYLDKYTNSIPLGKDQYFACGDNQFNSLDSRYWGPVPRKNLVGPAVFIYWPISRHFGLAE